MLFDTSSPSVKTYQQFFIADEKFEEVTRQLTKRGWHQHFGVDEKCANDHTVSLLWTNLRNVNFDRNDLDNIWVNHFKGAQHLSNKAFLAYHLHNAQCQNILPLTWSPAYQTVPELIEIILVFTIDSYNTLWNCPEKEQAWFSECQHKLNQLRAVVDRLKMSIDKKNVLDYQQRVENLNQLLYSSSNSGIVYRNPISNTNMWIVKPVGSSCGERIEVCRGMEETLSTAKMFSFKCIVQKYIENTLLVRNRRKFDIRQWILVTSLYPLVIFGFSECYLRLSSTEYSLDEQSLTNKFVHLCNHAIQKDYSHQVSCSEYECDTMMSQAEFDMFLVDYGRRNESSKVAGYDCINFKDAILPQIKAISIKAVAAVRHRMKSSRKSFEWLGLDLMVTESLEVKLIEVNVSPDISHSTSITSRLVSGAVEDLFAMILDECNSDERYGFSRIQAPENPTSNLRWDCWFAERRREEEILPNMTEKKVGVVFRPDCLPMFSTVGDEVLSKLRNTSMKDHNKSKLTLNENDDEDEI